MVKKLAHDDEVEVTGVTGCNFCGHGNNNHIKSLPQENECQFSYLLCIKQWIPRNYAKQHSWPQGWNLYGGIMDNENIWHLLYDDKIKPSVWENKFKWNI